MAKENNNAIRILIVDDHSIFRAGLRMLLETDSAIVIIGEAGDRESAFESVRATRPDVMLLDLDLGNSSGLDIVTDVLKQSNPPRIIILTGVKDCDVHKQAIQLGAMGLVLKNDVTGDLIAAIKAVHAGEVWFNPSLLWQMVPKTRSERISQRPDPEDVKIASLTKRELEVIALVTKGLKNLQIAESLYISEATVRHHLTSIFSKLGKSDRFELVVYAYQQGLAKPQSSMS